jgi:hypothetical protein
MAGRRGWGEDSIYFDHSGECRDPETYRHCPVRWLRHLKRHLRSFWRLNALGGVCRLPPGQDCGVEVPAVVMACDPGWPGSFQRLRDRIDAALAGVAHVTEHVGSTAVPGLDAKPPGTAS